MTLFWGDYENETHEILTSMKLEEKVRAALAEANYMLHIDQRLQEMHALEGENLQLKSIDNDDREVQPKEI